jgi:hypothetical protein
MRSSHKNRNRNRHRSSGGGGGSSGGNPLNRVYESNGPDVKVRGTAQTIADKYLQLGRDAQSSGDIVAAESYYQYAEHYLRIVAAAQAYNAQQQQFRRPDEEFDDEDLDDVPEVAVVEQRNAQMAAGDVQGMGDQPPVQAEGERPQQPQQQHRPPRDQNGQSYQNRDRDRDRNRSRWQDRRDQPRDGGDQRQQGGQPRGDEQPRMAEAQVTSESDGKWEAPSFLRRPAAANAAAEPAAEAAAPAAAPAAAAAEPMAEAAPPPKRKPRTPKAAKAAAEAESSETPPVAD